MLTKGCSEVNVNKGLMSSKISAFLVVTFNEIGSLRDWWICTCHQCTCLHHCLYFHDHKKRHLTSSSESVDTTSADYQGSTLEPPTRDCAQALQM